MLPSFASSQMTATHQLKTAVTSVAFAGRSLFLTSLSTSAKQVDLGGGDDEFINLLMISLSNALLGMDANDPPKTLATMQLIGSIFSNVSFKSPIIIANMSYRLMIFEQCFANLLIIPDCYSG